MNAKNCAGLLSKANIDGGLIGGASLKSADFAVIVAAAK
jgi:triosephosphate isomerase